MIYKQKFVAEKTVAEQVSTNTDVERLNLHDVEILS